MVVLFENYTSFCSVPHIKLHSLGLAIEMKISGSILHIIVYYYMAEDDNILIGYGMKYLLPTSSELWQQF